MSLAEAAIFEYAINIGAKLAMDATPGEVFTHSRELLEMGLDIPQITRVFLKLQEAGMDVPLVYTTQQAVDALRGGIVHA